MRWKTPPDPQVWHPHFAWRPVEVGDKKVWLEWVERRGEPFGLVWVVHYRLPVMSDPVQSQDKNR
jgi:hypothetical protein